MDIYHAVPFSVGTPCPYLSSWTLFISVFYLDFTMISNTNVIERLRTSNAFLFHITFFHKGKSPTYVIRPDTMPYQKARSSSSRFACQHILPGRNFDNNCKGFAALSREKARAREIRRIIVSVETNHGGGLAD